MNKSLLEQLAAADVEVARRVLEVMPLFTALAVEEVSPGDRLALRIAFELLLERLVLADDDERALRIEAALREGLR